MTRRTSLALGIGVVAFAMITTMVGIASGAPPQFLVADAAIGGIFIAAGFVGVWLRPMSPAGPMLLAAGGLWFVGSYAPTGQPVVTHLGFAFERYYDLVLAALLLLLSAPGRPLHPRGLIWGMAAAMAARSAGRLLLQDPVRLYPDCVGCPANPFAIWPDRSLFETSEFVTNLVIAVLAVTIGVVALRRLVAAGPVARRARWPVIAAGGVAMAAAALDAFEYAWETLTGAPLVEMPEPWAELYGWSGFALRALVPIGFLAGALWERGGAGRLAPFAATIGRAATPEGLGDALRRALRDPSLEILRPATDGRWITESGGAVELPSPSGQRTVTLVERDGGRPLAAIVHDAALREHPELFDSVVAILRLALENEQLQAEVRGQLREVTESRARIVTAGEEERRRIERDLHDGAQQRLVAVLLRLQQARALAADPAVPDELQKGLDGIADELGHATRELRELARGIHPAILEEDGLGPAVAGLARRSTIPVDVEIDVGGRLPSAIESTAYFTIAESLTNAQRHAEAGRASVRLSRADGILSVEVDDDGRGGADPGRGSGLRGLDDRVTALGGHLEINSEPGRGTRVRASLPIP